MIAMSAETALFNYLMRLLGTPYRWGGDDPMAGFDCSGLVVEFLQAAGVLPRGYDGSAQALCDHFPPLEKDVRFGTLLFFGTGLKNITHVAIALNPTHMVEAGGGGSATTDLKAAEAQNAFIRVRPITWRSDLVARKQPAYQLGG